MRRRTREDDTVLADPADGVGLGVDGAACVRTPSGPTVLVAPPMGAGMQALMEGELTDVGGYLGVGSSILWLPAGVTLVDDDPLVLRVLGGREVGLGDTVVGGGGHTEASLKRLGIDPDDDVTTLEVFLAYVVR